MPNSRSGCIDKSQICEGANRKLEFFVILYHITVIAHLVRNCGPLWRENFGFLVMSELF